MPGIISGDDVWVQGYSEYDAGSDLASLKIRGELDGEEWILNGQKIWTSRGLRLAWCYTKVETMRDLAHQPQNFASWSFVTYAV